MEVVASENPPSVWRSSVWSCPFAQPKLNWILRTSHTKTKRMVWKATVSPYRIILRVPVVWTREKDLSWVILRLCTNAGCLFFIKYKWPFLTVKISGWRGRAKRIFFLSSVSLVFIHRIIFPHSFPPSSSWLNKMQGRSISWLTRRKKGADRGRRRREGEEGGAVS